MPQTLRERQAEQTRQLILDALIEQLVETGAFEYSVFEIARRAGVAVRTVYRHFPDRESLFKALGEQVNERVGLRKDFYPSTPDDMVALPKQLFPRFDANAALVRAQLRSGAGAEVRQMARRERLGAVRAVVDGMAPDLDEAARLRGTAVLTCLLSANSWQRMADELGMDGVASGDAVSWALGVLVDALKREQDAARKKTSRGKKEGA